MQLKNIAIVGAGGNIGKHVVPKLLSDGHFEVTALTRGNYRAPDARIKVATVDYSSRASLAAALQGQDAVLSLVPGGQAKWGPQKLLIDASIDAGAQLFVPSEFVANILAPQYAVFPASFVGDKVALRHYLAEQAAAGKICWAALNGGPFFDMCFDIAARKATIYGTGDNLACWTPLPFIAAALLNMLRAPDAVKNRAVFVCGVRGLTQNALLEALEAEVGEKFDVERVDVKKMKADALELLERGEVKAAMRGLTLSGQFNEEGSAADFWHLVENELVGVEPVSVREAVRMTLAAADLKERITSDSWDGRK
ncbi:putative isoflavone reductase family protein [Diplodia seriata]|uniref:Putative isoflavone reductase family protein n=1 Tax=Diplodia seriata TaxID=420778 RepID=A0A0G2EII8_9PEZI|nr:putative isoflavone reductase family protein [Diplodia seriata]